jgi:hypothetical protein
VLLELELDAWFELEEELLVEIVEFDDFELELDSFELEYEDKLELDPEQSGTSGTIMIQFWLEEIELERELFDED